MTKQYWIGGFFIDLSRNQITQNNQSQTIAPKAMAVLNYLAENQGKVVSQDALLDEIWPDTIVSPNTLQRCIAQLRKALGDDGKVQAYIKTHAKQGYSLECDVRRLDTIDTKTQTNIDLLSKEDALNSKTKDEKQASHVNHFEIESPKKPKSSFSTLLLISIFSGIVILGIIGVKYFSSSQASKLSFGELRALTATDKKELGGIYSPDGQYIVFNRYSEEFCMQSIIWAKNTDNQKEIQLTKNWGAYSSHSFSKDGKKLILIETENCNKPVTQKDCYKLISFDFEKALETPQSPNVIMECKNSRITKPTWLNNNNVALLQDYSDRKKLVSYSIEDNISRVIYSPDEGTIIDYDYSVTDDVIALTSIHNDGQHYIELLRPDGQILSSHQIQYPPEIPNFKFIYPNFMPNSERLIFSTGRQLFTLSYEGEITNISLPLDEPMGSPIFHPDGKRMLMTKGHWDSDIAMLSLSQISNPQLNQIQSDQTPTREINSYSVIERSTLGDENAIYQPNGELIAFVSGRSGANQIWITDGNGSQQLTHFPIDTYIDGLDWAADGQSILVNANYMLSQVYLNSDQKSFSFDHRVDQLFQWSSEDNTALLLARINGVDTFGELNLTNSEFRIITEKKINWGLKSENGQLIYTDHMDRFWQPGPIEEQLIESLDSQGSDKRFITKNNIIYGINDEFQFWSYDLNEKLFVILGDVSKKIDYLNDINQADILITVRISAKKELAELILVD